MADRIAAERRCSPPASTPTDRPSYSNDAGVTAVPSRRDVGAHAEDPLALGLGDDGGVDVRIVGGGDRRTTRRRGHRRESRLSVNVIPLMASTAGVADLDDDVDVRAGCDQKRETALRDGAAPDDHDLLAGQSKADQVRVLGHPASLEAAAAATKRLTACGRAAGWVCR